MSLSSTDRRAFSAYRGNGSGRHGGGWHGGGFLLAVLIALEFTPPVFGCNVKGNISRETRERIYHVPGQKYYSQTRLNFFKGERWFCSEGAAIAAGWRKSKV
jgi:hypothetical protein